MKNLPMMQIWPLKPRPSSDFKNSWYVLLALVTARETASWYSVALAVANNGIEPIGMESCVTWGASKHDGETSKLYGFRLEETF